MKNFFKNLSMFILPLIILGVSAELLLRNIPNNYKYKKEYLDRKSDNIQALFLGSSHAYYGINPNFLHLNSFNASYISQTLDYDYEILKKYDGSWSNLKVIAIPISYFSLFIKLSEGIEYWRAKNYNIYYGMITSKKLSDYTELLSNLFEIHYKRIYSYYFQRKSNISCSKLGWGTNFKSQNKKDLLLTGKSAAKRHTYDINKLFQENINFLKSIVLFASERNVKVIFYTPPAFITYVENLNNEQLNLTVKSVTDIANKYENCYYFNLLRDKSFTDLHFYDADHLNEIGAQALSLKINKIINSLN